MESKNPIQVADKLFLVLETLAKTGPIGLSDLCREVSLNKTTVHRLLNSLLYMGYVRQDTQTSRYSLSFKIWDIANQFVSKIDIVEEARPSLRELAAKTGETVHLVQIDGIHAIYIAKEESENSVRLVSLWSANEFHSTAPVSEKPCLPICQMTKSKVSGTRVTKRH